MILSHPVSHLTTVAVFEPKIGLPYSRFCISLTSMARVYQVAVCHPCALVSLAV